MRLPEGQPLAVERLNVPGRVVQEVVEALALAAWYQRGQHRQRLVVLTWEQQPDQVLPERRASSMAIQQMVKLGTERIDRAGGRLGRFAGRGHGETSCKPLNGSYICVLSAYLR